MTEERVTTYETPEGKNTTIIHEGPARSSGGMGWLFGIILLIAILLVFYLLAVRGDSETARDSAIADAATEVGSAARQVGTAAEDAANKMTDQ